MTIATPTIIQDMRRASSIVFRHKASAGKIEAIHVIDSFVRLEYAQSEKHGPNALRGADKACVYAFEYIGTGAPYNEDWIGITGAIRPGDDLCLGWTADAASNEYMDRAGLHGDTLRLSVKRGAKRFAFVVRTSTCPDNSARMIRPSSTYL